MAVERAVNAGEIVQHLKEQTAEMTESIQQGESDNMKMFLQNIFSMQSEVSEGIQLDTKKGATLTDVLNQLSNLVEPSKIRHKNSPNDKFNKISILSQTIKGYLRLLNDDQTSKLLEDTFHETSQLTSSLFGIESGYSYFHDAKHQGLLRVCKLALFMKFTKYASDGFTALYTRPPVIYVSGAAPANFGKELRAQLGLPQSSICKVPCNTMFGSPYTMDVAAFERLLTDDVSCGKTPLLLIAFAGTPVTGHTDNLSRFREICTQSGVWLHIEGDSLASLALNKIPGSISAATSADSFTLNLPDWFGAANIPYCTTYKTSNPDLAGQSGLVAKEITEKFTCLPLWMIIKSVGLDELKNCIINASDLAQQLSHRIDMVSGTKRLEQSNVISTTVVFKYKATPSLSYSSSNSLEEEDDDDESPKHKSSKTTIDVSPKLCDALNEVLAERLQESCEKVEVTLTQVSREGSCIAFNPLKSSRALGSGKDDIDNFVEELEKEITKLDSTLISRSFFQDAFQTVPDVILIDSPDSPVVGAFQCIPKYWKVKDISNLSDSKKKELNDLNQSMLNRLSHEFHYLSEGRTIDGQFYVNVGVIDDSFDTNALAEKVKYVAEELEDNTKFLESISDAVQKSIIEAEAVLQRESEEKFFEEGVLRHVPLIGSVFSWLSPPPKETHGVTGRAFNLASGKLQSTEKTYKYKMQLQGEDGQEDDATQGPSEPVTQHATQRATPTQSATQPDELINGLNEDKKSKIDDNDTEGEVDGSKEERNQIEERANTQEPKQGMVKDGGESSAESEKSKGAESGEEVKESDV